MSRRGGRWDETKPAAPPGERDTWRRDNLPATSPGAEERAWRGGAGPGPAGPPPGPRGPAPPGRWGPGPEEERPRGAGWGPRSSLDEMPRRPPPGMGHEDKWGGGPSRTPWDHDGREQRGGGEREWGRREFGGGGGGHAHWDHDPAWMHDGQEGGAGPASGAPSSRPPPPTARQAMTAKDIERERQEMQAQWRAQQAAKVRPGVTQGW